ncbi:hypothetical protein GCWU000324_00453 [Kingella oralis ATCC 51147]|uniref:Uncharacterized protein n=1 Tax=Kingella oralis ATCC 51147 TaxID=629741 RepID=C4GHW5_9NEIS|nr:hypothetical protein GCWU000324_00453 [Kingella oralis ATCC 51147]
MLNRFQAAFTISGAIGHTFAPPSPNRQPENQNAPAVTTKKETPS